MTLEAQISQIMNHSREAFLTYQNCSGKVKKTFLYTVASEIEALGDELLETAAAETNLPVLRFAGERERTCNVFRMFGNLVGEGSWVDAVIDHRDADRKPVPRPEMRKMLIALGPIVVFGASNFPLAYATPGGDTASALAAGCTVVVKGHPLHPKTSRLIAGAFRNALLKNRLPDHIFQLVESDSFEAGKLLTQHDATAGVGFTGSLNGGNAILKYAQQRTAPIPVFAEMGSINPVVLLPDSLRQHGKAWATSFADSVTIGVGQFCTKPGIQLLVKSPESDDYIQCLAESLAQKKVYRMLSEGIRNNYLEGLNRTLQQKGVSLVYSKTNDAYLNAELAIAKVKGDIFEANPQLHKEIFGPFSLIVECSNMEQLVEILRRLNGQLTTTIIGTDTDLHQHRNVVSKARNIAGRIVFNGTPTGVEVANATVHGGQYPATTDPRFTSVGMDAIKRWVRPVCFQECPDHLLPEELQENNPLGIWRKVDGEFVR